jgi:O-antigen/teichoic acid export membrane protein
MADPTAVPATPSERAADRAAANAGVRAVAEIVAKVASLGLLFVLARKVGPHGLGVYVFALAWSELANLPVDMGFDRYLTRQVAKDRGNVERLLLNIAVTKGLRAGPVLIVSGVLLIALGYPGGQREAVYVAMLAVLFESLGGSIIAVFTGLEHGGLAAAVLMCQRLLTAILGILALATGGGVVSVLIAYAISTVVALTVAIALMVRRLGRLQFETSRAGRREVSRRTMSLAAQEVFSTGLARADAVLLSLLGTTVAVGQYGAGYRLMESTLFIPLALTSAFAAMFAYLHHESSPTIQSAYGYALKAVIGLLVPCAVTLFLLPGPVLDLLFGDRFHGAIAPLRLLAPVVVLLGVVLISYSLVISRRDPRVVAWAFAAALAVNLAANLALIPTLGPSGAATGMLLTEGLFAIAMYELAARTVGRPELTRVFAGPTVAGVAMALGMVLLVDVPLAAAAVGVSAYVVVLVVAERAINPHDLRLAQGVARRRLARRMRGAGA